MGADGRRRAQDARSRPGASQLVKDAFVRLRAADGFSHARSLAFVTSLVFVQGLIALVGLASAFGDLRISRVIVDAIQSAVPGPVERAADGRRRAGEEGRAATPLPAAARSGWSARSSPATTAMGQIERGFNRIYGIEQDRPTLQKYGRAFLLAVERRTRSRVRLRRSSRFGRGARDGDGRLLRATSGRSCAGRSGCARRRRWLWRRCFASRRAGGSRPWSWLAFGAGVCVAGLGARDARARARLLRSSSSFGETYGPLAGHRRTAALDAALGDRDLLRRGGRRAARGRPRGRAGAPRRRDRRRDGSARDRAGDGRPRRRRCGPASGPRMRAVARRDARELHEPVGERAGRSRGARAARRRSASQSSSMTSVPDRRRSPRAGARGAPPRAEPRVARQRSSRETTLTSRVVEQRVLVEVRRADGQPAVVDDRRPSRGRRSGSRSAPVRA